MFRRAFIYAVLLVAFYISALVYFDRRNGVFGSAREIGAALLPVCLASLLAFGVRYTRWRWLLRCSGYRVPWTGGLLAYLAGFALTASPGKVGELIRIRYFARLGIPPDPIVGCMISERTSDVIVLLVLSTMIISATGFWLAATFAALVVLAVVAMIQLSSLRRLPAYWMRRKGWRAGARYARVIDLGIATAGPLFRPAAFGTSMMLGLAIYGVHALSFVYLANSLHLGLPTLPTLGVYPLGTLIGAASLLPGGIGTTEVAIVILLRQMSVPLEIATIASLTMRLASTWLAIALGLTSAAVLELRSATPAPTRPPLMPRAGRGEYTQLRQ
jgi:uncharacterized membrane protein YbhN (UPF0104 family)